MNWLKEISSAIHQKLNRRLYRRVDTKPIAVKIMVAGERIPRLEKITNWSPGGIFVTTKDVIPEGASVKLEFGLGKEGSVVQLKAQVVRHQTNEKTQEATGMGLMFTDFTESGLTILRDLLLHSATEE
jgi:hypothetical protein